MHDRQVLVLDFKATEVHSASVPLALPSNAYCLIEGHCLHGIVCFAKHLFVLEATQATKIMVQLYAS